MLSQTRSCLIVVWKTYRGDSGHGRPIPRHLEGRILNTQWARSLVYLLTIHYHSHILDKAVDNLKGLRRGYPSLVQGEPV